MTTMANKGLLWPVDQPLPIPIIADDLPPGIAPRHHMINGASKFDPKSSRHAGRLAAVRRLSSRKQKSLTMRNRPDVILQFSVDASPEMLARLLVTSPILILHAFAARVKKPVGMFGSGLFAIRPPSHRNNKEHLRFFYPHQRRLAGFGTGFTLE